MKAYPSVSCIYGLIYCENNLSARSSNRWTSVGGHRGSTTDRWRSDGQGARRPAPSTLALCVECTVEADGGQERSPTFRSASPPTPTPTSSIGRVPSSCEIQGRTLRFVTACVTMRVNSSQSVETLTPSRLSRRTSADPGRRGSGYVTDGGHRKRKIGKHTGSAPPRGRIWPSGFPAGGSHHPPPVLILLDQWYVSVRSRRILHGTRLHVQPAVGDPRSKRGTGSPTGRGCRHGGPRPDG